MKKIHQVEIGGIKYWRVEQGMKGSSPLVCYIEEVHDSEVLKGWQLGLMFVILFIMWELPKLLKQVVQNQTVCEVYKKLIEHFACAGCEKLLYYVIIPMLMLIGGCSR